MPPVMSQRDSRDRAERVFLERSVLGLSWRTIAATEGFTSVGGAQRAYERHRARNAPPDAATALTEILERKRFATGKLATALVSTEDPRAVAELVRALTAQDTELARLYGVGSSTVDVRVQHSLSESLEMVRQNLHAVMDAEVIDVREIEGSGSS